MPVLYYTPLRGDPETTEVAKVKFRAHEPTQVSAQLFEGLRVNPWFSEMIDAQRAQNWRAWQNAKARRAQLEHELAFFIRQNKL
jgi:hypothetical protein